MFVFNRADQLSTAINQVDRLHIARERGIRIDMNEPRRTEPNHPLIALRKDFPGGFIIKPVGFKIAVDTSPVNSADNFSIADPPSRSHRLIATQTPLQAVP